MTTLYTKHSPLQIPADIITLRCDKDMVYVPPPPSYKEVISQAFNSFPQLRNTPTNCVSLSLNVTVRGECHTVRISPSAWKKLRHRVTQYEIVDIAITEEPLYGHTFEPESNEEDEEEDELLPSYEPKQSKYEKLSSYFPCF